jgi:DNA-binding GntR family transcriptional regulator
MASTIRSQITESLRSRLLANEWSSGTRLKEEELAREFGVSRGPIRDVFLELTKEGYLRMLPNRGASVNGFPSNRSRPIYLRTRRELEAMALKQGFADWKPADMLALEKILRHFRVSAEANDLPDVIQQDMAFHRFIIEHYEAEDLSIIWRPLMTTLALPYSRHKKLMESYEEHAEIFEALKADNLKESISLLKKHIQ